MQFPTLEMDEHEQRRLLQKIERELDDLVQSSKNDGLNTITVTKDTKYIKSEYFLNKGKPYIKAITEGIEVILPVHVYNSNFSKISEDILNNRLEEINVTHTYNTRKMKEYSNDPISITFTKPVTDWFESEDFHNSMNTIISYLGTILGHLYPYCDTNISDDKIANIVVNSNFMIENSQLMIYGEASSLLAAVKKNCINDLVDNILNMINQVEEDMSEPPPPVRLSLDKFKEILPIINAKKEHTIHTCAICMEDIKVRSRICMTKCGHCFHSKCLKKWLVNKCQTPQCPCCRKSLLDESPDE
tara:strand:- start:10466 stop:11371 length:906 start_codon:yes stop_codon:yes gene_type:complete